jgi:2-succinyl-5-enolpyruvyl-6-hydroxy-3-cyclohexene-1-carboxylate synthase
MAVSELARALRCPLFADPLSGLRFGNHLHGGILSHYDAFLRNPKTCGALRPAWVLRFGNPPVSKSLQAYLGDRPSSGTVLVAPDGDWPDPMHNTGELIQASPVEVCRALCACNCRPAPPGWLEAFEAADRRAGQKRFSGCDDDMPFEGDIIRVLLEALPPHSLLFCGNSMPIRALDTWSGTGSKPLRIYGNRGVSGIDGHVSTLLGLAAGAHGQPAVGLLGDLAFYHDMNGLLAARNQDAVIVVLNNGGGGIFGYLPQAELPQFERYWLTPTSLDLGRVAELYGLDFQRIEKQSSFAPAFAGALEKPGVSLVEVTIDRQYSMARHRAYWADAAEGFLPD